TLASFHTLAPHPELGSFRRGTPPPNWVRSVHGDDVGQPSVIPGPEWLRSATEPPRLVSWAEIGFVPHPTSRQIGFVPPKGSQPHGAGTARSSVQPIGKYRIAAKAYLGWDEAAEGRPMGAPPPYA